MNLAEQILRRKHESMYKPRVVVPPVDSPTTASAHSSHPQRSVPAPSAPAQSGAGVDAILTRDGRIRRVQRDTNRTGAMSDINVDLDL